MIGVSSIPMARGSEKSGACASVPREVSSRQAMRLDLQRIAQENEILNIQ
jgi:hypothetical protein